MALSDKVTESLSNAESELRNALASAARQERPAVCGAISELLSRIDHIKSVDKFIDKAEEASTDGDNPFNAFFKGLQ